MSGRRCACAGNASIPSCECVRLSTMIWTCAHASDFPTCRRQQLKTLPVRTPTWLKLYEVLVQLEKEIEEVLPEFQELVLSIS